MAEFSKQLGITVVLDANYEEVLPRVEAALKEEGFGILTEIDVKATLKKKIDVDFRPYKILGACNPPLAHQALLANPDIGLLLPCNVTVEQINEKQVKVAFLDPIVMMSMAGAKELDSVATAAREKLQRAALSLENG